MDGEVLYEHVEGVERIADTRRHSPTGTGTCFLCSSAAILRHFGAPGARGEEGLDRIYEVWKEVGAADGAAYTETNEFWSFLPHADLGIGWDFETVVDPPWDVDPDPGYRLPHLYSHRAYWRRVKVYLEAGYLVHANCLRDGVEARIIAGEPDYGPTDHLVVIDGYREVLRNRTITGGKRVGTYYHEIHVVCSSSKNPEPFWVDAQKWVDDHNGFHMWFVRPRRGGA